MSKILQWIITGIVMVVITACSGSGSGREAQAPKKTGQTQSYAEDGTVVIDGSLKDDGFYQKGVETSYSRNDNTDIVTDHITGLQWADDANVSTVTKKWLTDDNYEKCIGSNGQTQDSTKCTDTSGDTAVTYCEGLRLGGYTDWRLPTIKELMGIVDRGTNTPAIDSSYFQNVIPQEYWSSTTVVDYEDRVWSVYFNNGLGNWYYKYYSGNHICCVRDGQ